MGTGRCEVASLVGGLGEPMTVADTVVCSCTPCESPSYGAPGIAHCAACCLGSMIEAYDHDCPVTEHRELAVAQWGAR